MSPSTIARLYFGDGVYEVCLVVDGRLIDEARHMARLGRSLEATRIGWPVTREALAKILREVIDRNRVATASFTCRYRAASPGATTAFPKTPCGRASPSPPSRSIRASARPRLSAASKSSPCPTSAGRVPTSRACSFCPTCSPSSAAREAGAEEAWFVDASGFITEGSSTNAWIVTDKGVLTTRQADHSILHGVTRATLIDVAAARKKRETRNSPVCSRRGFSRQRGVFLQRLDRCDAGGRHRRQNHRRRAARRADARRCAGALPRSRSRVEWTAAATCATIPVLLCRAVLRDERN